MTQYIASFNWVTAIAVFFAYIIIDFLYASYTIYIQRKLAGRAASAGALMYSLMAFGIMEYTHNPLYIIFVAAGSWLGTYWSVKKL